MSGLYYTALFKNARTRKILVATIFTFLAWSIYFSAFTYRTLIINHREATLMRLFGIVNSVSLLIDGDLHTTLMNMYPKKDDIDRIGVDMYYDQIHQLLKSNEAANMLKTPIYTIVFDSTNQIYEFGVSSAEKPYFRHTYEKFPRQLMEQYEKGGMISPYKDEFGHWLSAFAPLKNKAGKTVGVLQADEKYDAFISTVKRAIWKSTLLSLLLLGTLFLILFRILNHILSKELNDKLALQNANETNRNMSIQLAQSLEELKKTNDFRKEMVANFSHDLRTPLSSITGYLELLINQEGTPINTKESKKYTQIAYNESLRLKRLVNELFELSKLESGQIKLKSESFSLAELTQDILEKYKKTCENKNINLITHFEHQLVWIMGDISWIDRLIQNLLDNAMKHVNHGGFIKCTISETNKMQYLKVCNSGTPIPKEELPLVFDRYFKSSTNSNLQSTGLGLAIVKKIVELHKGTVTAEVNEDITTFVFALPFPNS